MSARATAGRVMPRARAAEAAAEWRAMGLRVVLANGVFDLLHVGHARYLAGARALGDRLVVAVNGDRSAAHKGPGRPVVGEVDRARLVAALRGVDVVVVFHEATVAGLMDELRPDVHAKGTDYRVETVPERSDMERLGGVTAIAGDEKRHASRELVERIRGGKGAGA